MRNIYKEHTKHIEIQQGVIISGCFADNYESHDVFGLIITPRCDIGNGGKVSTIHYLPIVPYEEWKNQEIIAYRKSCIFKKMCNLQTKLQEKNISSSIFAENLLDEDSIYKIIGAHKDIVSLYKEMKALKDENQQPNALKDAVNNSIKDLGTGKHNRYYLIEDWQESGKFRVILLRQIKRLQYNFAMRLSVGVQDKILEDDERKNNDIDNFNGQIYKSVSEISSPFIEHIIQSFSHNFCRIGVENLECNIEELKIK